ncbi:ATP-dependent metalloprotease FtsH family protein, partial [Reticulomyxa filosa]
MCEKKKFFKSGINENKNFKRLPQTMTSILDNNEFPKTRERNNSTSENGQKTREKVSLQDGMEESNPSDVTRRQLAVVRKQIREFFKKSDSDPFCERGLDNQTSFRRSRTREKTNDIQSSPNQDETTNNNDIGDSNWTTSKISVITRWNSRNMQAQWSAEKVESQAQSKEKHANEKEKKKKDDENESENEQVQEDEHLWKWKLGFVPVQGYVLFPNTTLHRLMLQL